MIFLPEVRGLRLIKVFERGVPNQEAVCLRAEEHVDVGQYGLVLGWLQAPNLAMPIKDSFFYFGPGPVNKGDWIFVYTGRGEPRKATASDGTSAIYTLHWGRSATLFANSNIVPVLFQVGGVTIGEGPENKPQLGLLQSP